MEIELLPAVSLLPETLSVLIAPEEMLARALNGNPHLQQYRILFIAGIRSGILSRLDRELIVELDVRRAFTSVQLRTILEENHLPLLDSGAQPPPLQKGQGYGRPRCPGPEAGLSGCILLYVPVLDRHLETMAELADRVICFYDMQGAGLSQGRGISDDIASQTTWEAFS
jgi:hypothetical protein